MTSSISLVSSDLLNSPKNCPQKSRYRLLLQGAIAAKLEHLSTSTERPQSVHRAPDDKMPEPAATTSAITGTDAPTREEEAPEPLNFTLQVISNVDPLNLTFSHLPATTTIKQLKAKIREVLPSKPVDEHQRLIYRGRLLSRETDTMLDVFGQETV